MSIARTTPAQNPRGFASTTFLMDINQSFHFDAEFTMKRRPKRK
jgi:hypothetical protein